MTKTSNASKARTEKQVREFGQQLDATCEHAKTVVLDKVPGDKPGWQKVVMNGNKIRIALTAALVKIVSELCQVLLRYVTSVPMPATNDFILTEDFLVNQCGVRKNWIGDNFRRLFVGKTVKGMPAGSAAIHQLTQWATAEGFKEELGSNAVVPLVFLIWLLQQQKDGKPGTLLVNGCANIGIVELEEPDGKGGAITSSWSVDFFWSSGCSAWDVEANPLSNEWLEDDQVVSRDSVPLVA